MDRGAWQAMCGPQGCKELDTTEETFWLASLGRRMLLSSSE